MPTLTWDGYRFLLDIPFSERKTASAAGFHFDEVKRCWWTGLPSVAKIFESCADFKAKERLGDEQKQIALSRALESNLAVPAPEGLSLAPFQRAAVEYVLPRQNCLIADEMGVGKTVEAIGIINYDPSIKKILLICPATIRLSWSRELMKWLVRKFSGGFAFEKVFPGDADIVISSYDMVKKFRHEIDKHHWDLLIMDESHMVKSFQALRTRACLGGKLYGKEVYPPIQADRRIWMTGSPILNRPTELWPMLSVADPDDLGVSEWHFLNRYCKPWQSPWGTTEYSPNKENLEELQNRLRAKLMVRRLKKDVLKYLPPKRRQIIALPPEAAKKAVQAELEFYNRNHEIIEEAVQKAQESQQAGDELSYKAAAAELQKGRNALLFEMGTLRRATAVAKIPFIIEYLEHALEQKDKVVFFAHHLDVINAVALHFKKICVAHHGSMSENQKQAARDRFQGSHTIPQDPKCKLFIGAITISQGFDLTIADLCVMGELDWRPLIVTQAEDRLHRYTQLKSVQVVHLVFDGSLDATMVKKIVQKQEMIERSLG